jgi:hypothetical protein
VNSSYEQRTSQVTLNEAYAELGIDGTTATPGGVRSAFHSLVLQWHPDTVSDAAAKPAATEKMVRLNEAYQALKAARFPRCTTAAEDLKPVWSAQYDAGDAAFEKWFRDLDLGSIHASSPSTFDLLTPLERTIVAAVAIAILIGFGILLNVAVHEVSSWIAWRQRCPPFASTSPCPNQPSTEALANTFLCLFVLFLVTTVVYSQADIIKAFLRHYLQQR